MRCMWRAIKGFTLFEILFVTILVGLLIMVAFLLYNTGLVAQSVALGKLSLISQARIAMGQISQELMLASVTNSKVLTPPVGSNTDLMFQIPLVNAAGELVTDSKGALQWGDGTTGRNWIHYVLQGNNLTRNIVDATFNPLAGTSRVIAQDMSQFTVSITSGTLCNVTLSFSLTRYAGFKLPEPINYTLSNLINTLN